ncbi:pyridoxamine 5'-phosphate oxidase [Streptomyces roseoverticillatus]|uniref:pyridoxamine 5'-phosphate oxidase n=1 Tax=Streptomyces roseoverticillatus TaxID=66429 RepID=UPI001F2356B4|nr:pyridoxamine 5'-phosphate oxidase [Streptomyces roseoverticillatus]MCF3103952.1 pyridoxamine 5'-phosphate oxidase [Streptomyces roseoverticillatus]
MREQYRSEGISESDLAPDPYEQFAIWFAEVFAAGLREPNAMVVSTADADGRPSSRTVLLKAYDHHGFVFYTNYGSRKAADLARNPYVSLLFPWHPIGRQVIVAGTAERVDPAETAVYFHSRPRGSQLGAWASAQSAVVSSREEIDAAYERLLARYPEGEPVPVPTGWGGYRVTAESVEFWQGRENRLHDRLRYVREGGESWRVERLNP